MNKRLITALLIAAYACLAGDSTNVAAQASKPRTEAFVVLRGFGYSGDGARAFRSLEPAINSQGMDLHVPDYLSRSGLDDSRKNLQRYIHEKLARYERVHVFAFIAGGWSINPLVAAGTVPHLRTVIYDRSPLQERAPRIADEKLHFLTWVRYGSPVFDLAHTPYPPMTDAAVKVGLVVETTPTDFVRDHEQVARSYGPFRFDCDAFAQRHDDCLYVGFNHDELYVHFADVWPDVLAFIRTGRFSSAANRTPPSGDPFAGKGRP